MNARKASIAFAGPAGRKKKERIAAANGSPKLMPEEVQALGEKAEAYMEERGIPARVEALFVESKYAKRAREEGFFCLGLVYINKRQRRGDHMTLMAAEGGRERRSLEMATIVQKLINDYNHINNKG